MTTEIIKLEQRDLKPVISYIESLQKLQEDAGSMDAYGIGFYNGIEFIRACLSGTEPKYKNVKNDN